VGAEVFIVFVLTLFILRVLGFAIFFWLWFLSTYLGAGSGKRTPKTLGAHQLRFGDRSEKKPCCFRFTDQITFPVLEIQHS
jgi:hypothetical protein